MTRIKCRACNACGLHEVLNLGNQPPSNALLNDPCLGERYYPLRLAVCRNCWLLQLSYDVSPLDLFNDEYPYYSGQSKHWVEHCAQYAQMIYKRLGLNNTSTVIEIGGNDGTLLKNFVRASGTGGGKSGAGEDPVFFVANYEPSASVAAASRRNGVPTIDNAWGRNVQQVAYLADLIIANNVMAHTPDLRGFVETVAKYLNRGGTFTAEFPWALNLIEQTQFDTIYHEHYSYLSLHALVPLFLEMGLRIYDVEELPTHGGSLRIYASRIGEHHLSDSVLEHMAREAKLTQLETYVQFRERAYIVRADLEAFLAHLPDEYPVAMCGYGAAAKGNTLINWLGLDRGHIVAVGDTTPAKIGKFLPGSRIPVVSEEQLLAMQPDYILILPWNWEKEITAKIRATGWNGKFVTAIPELRIF